MLTLQQAREKAIKESKGNKLPLFICRYYYRNGKDLELLYTVSETTRLTKTVETYLDGKKVDS